MIPTNSSTAATQVRPLAYKVEVSFNTVRLDDIEDGCLLSDCTADAMGSLSTLSTNGYLPWSINKQYRNFGGDGGHGGDSWWNATGEKYRYMDSGVSYNFAATRLCSGSTGTTCSGSDLKQNNKVILEVKPNSSIQVSAKIKDYDPGSDDDTLCNVSDSVGALSAVTLKDLNMSRTMAEEKGDSEYLDASCEVTYSLKTIGYVWPNS
ncbi:hypothetical protein [Streptomyces sp. NPDC053431]|uniref:hypothetical protein n=1 Tax=Streptomyces sp. NPDC053431 TaxID=3365703 RepID=UPI0037CD4E5A